MPLHRRKGIGDTESVDLAGINQNVSVLDINWVELFDPDYQKILATFAPITAMLKARPRIDMPGGKPAADVCRDCQ